MAPASEVIQYIIPFLNHNNEVIDLDVLNNQIGDAGAAALADNQTLTILDVGNNPIGEMGRSALNQSIQARHENFKKEKLAFLSVMTLTNTQHLEPNKKVPNEGALNDAKQQDIEKPKHEQALLFKYCNGFNRNGQLIRLNEEVLGHIFEYNKPNPLKIVV